VGLNQGLAADLGLLAGERSWAGDDSHAPGRLLGSAEQFITLFHSENRTGPPGPRLRQVRREIEMTGTYRHTADELEFGARVAWRNSSRCIGRLYWHSLRVRDRRDVTAAPDIAAESVAHLREATNGGRIRPVITVFAPDAPGRPGPRILSSQLVRYAGYQSAGGAVTGDPANTGATRLARDLGWPGGRPPGRFDILPLLVREADAPVTLHELPADAVLEVNLEHPQFGWFAGLGLRWHAVPVISDMCLDIGGVCYPAAPFNGWYMCTEIGSRDLGDTGRYDQLPVIARHMGLPAASDRTLWKDKAMTELNLAVLHSFTAAGVTISDHHTESVRFLQHMEREERQGRACPADWTWIVPPAASSATPVFHRYYQDFQQTPNFHRHPAPAPRLPCSSQAAQAPCTGTQRREWPWRLPGDRARRGTGRREKIGVALAATGAVVTLGVMGIAGWQIVTGLRVPGEPAAIAQALAAKPAPRFPAASPTQRRHHAVRVVVAPSLLPPSLLRPSPPHRSRHPSPTLPSPSRTPRPSPSRPASPTPRQTSPTPTRTPSPSQSASPTPTQTPSVTPTPSPTNPPPTPSPSATYSSATLAASY
jgi:nitric-oxide synthase